MFTLHQLGDGKTVSVGLLDPHPPTSALRLYDFGLGDLRFVDAASVVAAAATDPARASFTPKLIVSASSGALRMAANPSRKVIRLRPQRSVATNFVTGYDSFAAPAARHWREHGAPLQALLAAGVFSLSTIQTSIWSALRLFALLTPHVLVEELPSAPALSEIVKTSGAGLDDPVRGRPSWYLGFADFRQEIKRLMDQGLRDDELRRRLATETDMPRGLGLAKLSFVLSLAGNNCGCLDARLLEYSFPPATRKRFEKAIAKKGVRFSDRAYGVYRSAELKILKDRSPFYESDNPVALARSQWMLWESLGPEVSRTHTHEELFSAVLEPAWMM
jgi:hypothetical protein